MTIPFIPTTPERPTTPAQRELLDVARIAHEDIKRNRMVTISLARDAANPGNDPKKWTIIELSGDKITVGRRFRRTGTATPFDIHIRGAHFFDGAGNQLQVLKYSRATSDATPEAKK